MTSSVRDGGYARVNSRRAVVWVSQPALSYALLCFIRRWDRVGSITPGRRTPSTGKDLSGEIALRSSDSSDRDATHWPTPSSFSESGLNPISADGATRTGRGGLGQDQASSNTMAKGPGVTRFHCIGTA